MVIDHHSRYVWAKATNSNTTQATIGTLDNIFKSFGFPKRILTDNGTNFTNRVFKRYLNKNNVHTSRTTSYHPQTNGANEKANHTIFNGLRLAVQENPKLKWSTLLVRVVDNYNNTVHSATGFTPSFLMFGKDKLNTKTPLDEARLQAQKRSDEFKEKTKAIFDRIHKPLFLKPGDLVKKRIPSNHPSNTKLTPKYDAVFKVVSQVSPVNYEIIKLDDDSSKFNIHVCQLEPYFQRLETSFDTWE